MKHVDKYSELEKMKEFEEDKCKAIIMWLAGNHIRTLFDKLNKERIVTDDMKITIVVKSPYYQFEDKMSKQGENYSAFKQKGKSKENENKSKIMCLSEYLLRGLLFNYDRWAWVTTDMTLSIIVKSNYYNFKDVITIEADKLTNQSIKLISTKGLKNTLLKVGEHGRVSTKVSGEGFKNAYLIFWHRDIRDGLSIEKDNCIVERENFEPY